jgi:hypothetical protein
MFLTGGKGGRILRLCRQPGVVFLTDRKCCRREIFVSFGHSVLQSFLGGLQERQL